MGEGGRSLTTSATSGLFLTHVTPVGTRASSGDGRGRPSYFVGRESLVLCYTDRHPAIPWEWMRF